MSFIGKLKFDLVGGKMAYEFLTHLECQMQYDALIEKTLNTIGGGTSKEPLCDEEVLVSLTTYGKRVYSVAATIESIMQGTVKPNRIILWLGEDMKSLPLPVTLQRQMERGLEIEYCKDIRSFTKLIPCLKKYPEACIITIDDDIIYPYDLVENLVNMHKQHPQNIISNRVHRIALNENGEPLSYVKWQWCIDTDEVSPLNFQTGVGGVLYPPHCLDDEVFNEDVFMNICKFADDVWFYAMALKKGTKVQCGLTIHPSYEIPAKRESTLSSLNVDKNMNDVQFAAVFEKYGLYEKLKQ